MAGLSAWGPSAVMNSLYFKKREAERAGGAAGPVSNPALWMVLGSPEERACISAMVP